MKVRGCQSLLEVSESDRRREDAPSVNVLIITTIY
jgi:hypothetical protein